MSPNKLQTYLANQTLRIPTSSTSALIDHSRNIPQQYRVTSMNFEARHYVIFFITRSLLPMIKYAPQYQVLKQSESAFFPWGDLIIFFEMLLMKCIVVHTPFFRNNFIQQKQFNSLSEFIFGNSTLKMEAAHFSENS